MINVTNFMKFNFMSDVIKVRMISGARKVCAWKSSFFFISAKVSCCIIYRCLKCLIPFSCTTTKLFLH